MKKASKIMSFVLSIVMLVGCFAGVDLSALATEQEEATLPNRAEWLSILVEAFDMTVEEDNYPDNYFSDIDDQSPYYRNIMVATEFGFIDIEPGNPVNPDGEVTREFAAHTLNTGLGFVLDGAEDENYTYSFADSEACTYPVDDQIAVDKGWFTLDENNNFNPNENISLEELDVMLDFTLTEKTSDIISDDYDSKYDFADGVIVVPNGTEVSVDENDVVTITDLTKTINVGDSFVVFLNDLPVIYEATKVTTDGNNTVIETKKADNDSALESVDMQEVTTVDLSQFEPAEGFDVLYPSSQMSKGDSASLGNTSISLSGSFKIMDGLSVELKGKLSDIVASVKEDSATGAYIAKVDSKLDSTVTIKAEDKNDPDKIPIFATPEIVIGKVRILGIGYVKLSFVYSISGSVTIKQSYNVTAGVAYKDDNLKLVKSFKKDDFSIAVAAEVKVGFKQEIGIDVLVLNANINNEYGFKGKIEAKYYNSGLPNNCLSLEGYLYWTVGAEVSVKLGIYTKKLSTSYDIFDSKNSPIKIVLHFEDGNKVYECTRSEGKYITSKDSNKVNQTDESINDYISTSGDFQYSVNSDNTATITGYNGSATNLNIPKYIKGYKVTSIGDYAFSDCTSLTSVTIPNSVTSISNGAFSWCTSLTSVTIPNSVTSIGENAFSWCTGLTNVTIPNSVTSISNGTFRGCTSLTSVTIPNSVTSIGWEAFSGCTSLTSVTIPNSVTSIGEYAFSGCTSLTSVTIPNSVTSIGNSTFSGCSSLTSVTIPNSVTSIGSCAFYDCTSLTSVTIGNNVASIGDSAFEYCSSLTSVTIPNSVTSIGNYTFYSCASLTSVTIPNSVTSIGNYAFRYCTSLTSVTIPNSVTSIGSEAFYDCESLTSVTIPNSVTSIGNYAFYYCISLTSVTIPDSVTSIGYGAFKLVNNVEYNGTASGSPWEAKSINGYVDGYLVYNESSKTKLLGCSSQVTQVTIPNSVTSIGDYAFRGCISLKDVYFDGTVDQWNCIDIGYNNECLKNATIHFAKCDHVSDAGTVTKKATISSNGTKVYKCTLCNEIIKTSTINKIDSVTLSATSYTYDGTYKKPTVTVKDSAGTKLGTSYYTVAYSNNKAVGTATATITMQGNYSGTIKKTFTIKPQAISSSNVTLSATSYTYDGNYKKPTVTVKNSAGTKLGTSYYTVTYSNNKAVGTATATITMQGNYSGTIKKTFTIKPQAISSSNVTLSATSYTYDGTYKKPTVTVKNSAGTKLGTSYYTVAYSNNKAVGTATATITMQGNYSGTIKKTFTIKPQAISSSNVTLSATSYTYDGTYKKPTVTVKNAAGTKLGTSYYTVAYSNNKTAGTATAIITMQDNYSGTIKKTFTIKPQAIGSSNVTLSATSYTYDGTYKKPTVTVKNAAGTKLGTSYYTVAYSNNKAVGKATVTVTMKGNYSGTIKKTFKINPKGTSMSTLTATKGGFKATWKKQATQTTGYILQYSTSSSFSNYKYVTLGSTKTLSKAITGLS